MGLGNKPNATREITEEEMLNLFQKNYFGTASPDAVLRTLRWFVSINFGFRRRDEARQLAWGDVQIEHDLGRNLDYLVWYKERSRKRAQGRESDDYSGFSPRMYETKGERCPLNYFRQFATHRPQEANNPDSPFFLQALKCATVNDDIWYLNKPLGKNELGTILSKASQVCDFKGKKVANHSVRKTGIGRLLDANVPEIFVAQHSGMKSTDSLKSYKSANPSHQLNMSRIINEGSCSSKTLAHRTIPPPSSAQQFEQLVPDLMNDDETDSLIMNVPEMQLATPTNVICGLFHGAQMHNCTFNINFNNYFSI